MFWGWCPVGPDLVCSAPDWDLWGVILLGVVGPWESGCIHLPLRQSNTNPRKSSLSVFEISIINSYPLYFCIN